MDICLWTFMVASLLFMRPNAINGTEQSSNQKIQIDEPESVLLTVHPGETIIIGEKVTLNCSAYSHPEPRLCIYRYKSYRSRIPKFDDRIAATTGLSLTKSLTIRKSDNGARFYCKAYDNQRDISGWNFDISSNNVTLQVHSLLTSKKITSTNGNKSVRATLMDDIVPYPGNTNRVVRTVYILPTCCKRNFPVNSFSAFSPLILKKMLHLDWDYIWNRLTFGYGLPYMDWIYAIYILISLGYYIRFHGRNESFNSISEITLSSDDETTSKVYDRVLDMLYADGTLALNDIKTLRSCKADNLGKVVIDVMENGGVTVTCRKYMIQSSSARVKDVLLVNAYQLQPP